jgi:F0F1-type ATP synthase assembly protein I
MDTRGGKRGAIRDGSERHLPLIIVGLQAMTSLVVAAGLLLIDNWLSGAALLAGAVVAIPAAWFAWRSRSERSPGRLLAHGAMKVLVTLTSMALVFAVLEPQPLVFFGTFLVMQVMYVVGPLAFGK